MKRFFDIPQKVKSVTYNDFSFDLPILYFRDDFFGLYFTADRKKVKALMPSEHLHPVIINGRAIVAILAINYIETSIGPYGEVPVVVPVVYGEKPMPGTGLLPALMESKYPGFGVLVQHLPVTKTEARDAGRGEWGYTKFVADMYFRITPELMHCRMDEEDNNILEIQVARKGIAIKDRKPLVTYSVKGNNLIKTFIPQKSVKRIAVFPKDSYLTLGNHPVADSIKALDISDKPLASIYFPERAGILPEGQVIEKGVKAFEGYLGSDRVGAHVVNYL